MKKKGLKKSIIVLSSILGVILVATGILFVLNNKFHFSHENQPIDNSETASEPDYYELDKPRPLTDGATLYKDGEIILYYSDQPERHYFIGDDLYEPDFHLHSEECYIVNTQEQSEIIKNDGLEHACKYLDLYIEMEKTYPLSDYFYVLEFDDIIYGENMVEEAYHHADGIAVEGNDIWFHFDDDSHGPIYKRTDDIMSPQLVFGESWFLHIAAVPRTLMSGVLFEGEHVLYPEIVDEYESYLGTFDRVYDSDDIYIKNLFIDYSGLKDCMCTDTMIINTEEQADFAKKYYFKNDELMDEYCLMEKDYPITDYFYVIDVDGHVLKAEKLGIKEHRPVFIYERSVYEEGYKLEWPSEDEADYSSIFMSAIPRTVEDGAKFYDDWLYYAGEWKDGKMDWDKRKIREAQSGYY